MEVTTINNRWITWVNVINIALLLAHSVILINHIRIRHVFNYGLSLVSEISYVVLILYLISILRFAGEKLSIQISFMIYLALQLIGFITAIIVPPGVAPLNVVLGILDLIVIVSILISAIKVTHEKLAPYFKAIGITMILPMLLRIILPLIPGIAELMYRAASHGISFSGYLDLTSTIPLFAMLLLFVKTGKVLKEDIRQPNVKARL